MFYSTPGAYADVKIDYPINWTSKIFDDGLPYRDGPHSVWSGYFTSRISQKGYIRKTSNYFQIAKQVQTFVGDLEAPTSRTNPLFPLADAMGIAQHHDAVSGTEMQHVANDYAKRLAIGRSTSGAYLASSFNTLTGDKTTSFFTCDLSNATICPPLEDITSTTVLLVYNSQSQSKLKAPIKVPVATPTSGRTFSVLDQDGNPVVAQIYPASPYDINLRVRYYGEPNISISWIAFQAKVVALGYTAYFISPSAAKEAPSTFHSVPTHLIREGSISPAFISASPLTNSIVTISFDPNTGFINRYQNSLTLMDVPLTQQYLWYNASTGNADSNQASGAYIFRPNSSTPFAVSAAVVNMYAITGPVVNISVQSFGVNEWLSHEIQIWADTTTSEFEFTVGPVPFADNMGKEIVSRFSVPTWANQGVYYTDSNCREMYQRVRDYRPSWNFTNYEPVAANYYPVNSAISISDLDSGNTMVIATDRSQGGASIIDGSLELMIQRRLLADDARGVGEPLNETGLNGQGLVVRGVHRLIMEVSVDVASISRRRAMQDISLFPAEVFYGGINSTSPQSWISNYSTQFSGLVADLPPNVHLLTLSAWNNSTLLIRLAHLYAIDEDSALAAPVTVDLMSIFPSSLFSFKSFEETTLTANQPLSAVKARTYKTSDQGMIEVDPAKLAMSANVDMVSAFPVTLNPLQIRTFLASL
jgi:lysosomal alpha-mannosidase